MKNSFRLFLIMSLVTFVVPFITWPDSSAAQAPASQGQPDKFRRAAKPVHDRYIVVLKRETPREEVEATANELTAKHGGNADRIYTHAIKGFSMQMSEAAAMALSRNPKVEYVQEDAQANTSKSEATTNWNLDTIDTRTNLNGFYYFPNVETGAGVHAYIIDSGINISHREWRKPDGTGNRATLDVDFVSWDGGGTDCTGHGTSVAGIVGGRTFGVAKGVRLHGVRVFGCANWTLISTIIDGVDWVTQHHVKPAVANLSIEISVSPITGIDWALEDAIRGSIAAGVSYVVSAGNQSLDVNEMDPARIPEVLTVAASDFFERRTTFTNFGPGVDLFAPGQAIISASNTDRNGNGVFDDETDQIAGTSLSAAHVTGAVARFLQVNPGATPAAVHGAVVNSATRFAISDPGPGTTDRMLYTDIHNTKLNEVTVSMPESQAGVNSGIDVGPGLWLGFTAGGEIWSGWPFSGNEGPQGWNSRNSDYWFPLASARPFSLLGHLTDHNFYIGTSNSTSERFTFTQRLRLKINDDISGDGSGAFTCQIEVWKQLPDASADFIDQSVPAVMLPGQTAQVTIKMKNLDNDPWRTDQNYKLGAEGDSMIWGLNRVPLTSFVASNGEALFTFNITAPATPGTYNFQWRMLQEGVQRFGDVTPNVAITVLAPSNQAQFISQSVKTVITASEFATASITMKNVGNTTWTAGSLYRLGSQNPYDNMTWGLNRVALPNDVPPGATVTFTFDVLAPPKSGTYNFQWRMVQDGVEWFGPQTPNVLISVKPPACARC
ncbi:MAG TPA: S8 family serine peptidase [Pyrinomonadaceae bacterium]